MAPIKFGVGQSVLRKEDDALIRGKGRYTDDHAPQAAMHALVLRSPHAHAKFTVNATRARGLPEKQFSHGKIKSSWTGSSMVEQLTLNQRVVGSSPTRFTNTAAIFSFFDSCCLQVGLSHQAK